MTSPTPAGGCAPGSHRRPEEPRPSLRGRSPRPSQPERGGRSVGTVNRLRSERGAVGTEMAIVVAIVVAIAIALGAVMRNSAQNHQACIPENPGDQVAAGC